MHPLPSPVEIRSNATFEALMWALSRPGLIQELPAPGEEVIVEALIDRECRVSCFDTLRPAITRSGAEIVAAEKADHVFAGVLEDAALLGRLDQGSDMYPDDGATLILRGQIGEGQGLRLSGPGVDGFVEIQVGGLPDGFWASRNQAARYPMGVEIIVLDGLRVLGIPRSTKVEML